jgi:hypothetical protein
METEVQRIAAAQQARWQTLGVEPTPRGTPRLPQYRKDFDPEVVVTVRDEQTGECAPFLLRSGRPLKAAECLPERADLALDEQGRMLPQAAFEQRYKVYLESFVMPSDANPHFEPVPRVEDYINAKPDQWTASRGYVEIDFDPTSGGEFVPKFYVDPQGNSVPVEEYEADQAAKAERDDRMEALLLALGEKVLSSDSGDQTIVPVEMPEKPAPRRRGRPPKNRDGDEAA